MKRRLEPSPPDTRTREEKSARLADLLIEIEDLEWEKKHLQDELDPPPAPRPFPLVCRDPPDWAALAARAAKRPRLGLFGDAFAFKPKPKRKRGPKTKYIQLEIEPRLAALPPGLKVAAKAEQLGCSESTIYRLQRSKKSGLS